MMVPCRFMPWLMDAAMICRSLLEEMHLDAFALCYQRGQAAMAAMASMLSLLPVLPGGVHSPGWLKHLGPMQRSTGSGSLWQVFMDPYGSFFSEWVHVFGTEVWAFDQCHVQGQRLAPFVSL